MIWSRYSTQIIPVNYNLLAVNFTMGITGMWHLVRIAQYRYAHPEAAGAGAASMQ